MYHNMTEFNKCGELTVGRLMNGVVVQIKKQLMNNSADELWHYLKLFETIDNDTFKLYASIDTEEAKDCVDSSSDSL